MGETVERKREGRRVAADTGGVGDLALDGFSVEGGRKVSLSRTYLSLYDARMSVVERISRTVPTEVITEGIKQELKHVGGSAAFWRLTGTAIPLISTCGVMSGGAETGSAVSVGLVDS